MGIETNEGTNNEKDDARGEEQHAENYAVNRGLPGISCPYSVCSYLQVCSQKHNKSVRESDQDK